MSGEEPAATARVDRIEDRSLSIILTTAVQSVEQDVIEEIRAIAAVTGILDGMPEASVRRVVAYVQDRYGRHFGWVKETRPEEPF